MGALLKQEGLKKIMCDVLPRNGGTMFGVGTKTTAEKQEGEE